jgi:hypothetical protein
MMVFPQIGHFAGDRSMPPFCTFCSLSGYSNDTLYDAPHRHEYPAVTSLLTLDLTRPSSNSLVSVPSGLVIFMVKVFSLCGLMKIEHFHSSTGGRPPIWPELADKGE